ncbi:hypothetical protein [Paenibacillus cymbidii]|uniref:hypothetical protein n=1 Tax=Paenibacillus cymbidii TaxID=1639034 RepID=UPI0010807499|nr:hypothetical protein [Paenibacillus cymbidii]
MARKKPEQPIPIDRDEVLALVDRLVGDAKDCAERSKYFEHIDALASTHAYVSGYRQAVIERTGVTDKKKIVQVIGADIARQLARDVISDNWQYFKRAVNT